MTWLGIVGLISLCALFLVVGGAIVFFWLMYQLGKAFSR